MSGGSNGAPAPSRREKLQRASVELRAATSEDCWRIWVWRNDPETRRASLDPLPIAWDGHQRWFERMLGHPDRPLLVAVVGGEAVGVVRLDVEGTDALVSINVAPEWRGCGVGTAMLRAAVEAAFAGMRLRRLRAQVKADNPASLSAFRRAGFTEEARGEVIELTVSVGEEL